jgi:hypothetical protein
MVGDNCNESANLKGVSVVFKIGERKCKHTDFMGDWCNY